VQRIPVRIRVDQKGADILRAGMSSDVTVDTGKTRLDRGIF
jgi:multidrug resistance efflux pump